jgi:hypothetical protein
VFFFCSLRGRGWKPRLRQTRGWKPRLQVHQRAMPVVPAGTLQFFVEIALNPTPPAADTHRLVHAGHALFEWGNLPEKANPP